MSYADGTPYSVPPKTKMVHVWFVDSAARSCISHGAARSCTLGQLFGLLSLVLDPPRERGEGRARGAFCGVLW